MDFMGIGPLELILILILAFLFFGPDKLPEMAAKAGKLYRNFKKATDDLSKNITKDITDEIKAEKAAKQPPGGAITMNAETPAVPKALPDSPPTTESHEQ